MQPNFQSSRILLPARPWYVYGTLLFAFVLNLLPTGPLAFVPDWLAFVLCFWSVREFRKVGMGVAFLFGIAMDVSYGSLMGQHALAYVLLAYLSSSLSRRIMWFPIAQQAVHVLPIFIAAQLVQLVVRLISGADLPGFGYFLSPLFAALLWFPGTYLLLLPQYRPVERDENRPI
jgi:rod shape-determining protein MreD